MDDGHDPKDQPTPEQADRLNALSAQLAESGQHAEALEAARKAGKHYRLLAERNPAFQPDLAMSLNNLANRLSMRGHREEALENARQAVELYRQLADKQADIHAPELAISLGALGNILQQHDETAREAVDCFAEGIRCLTPLSLKQPDIHDDLLRKLAEHYLGNCLKTGIEPDMELLESFADALQRSDDEEQKREPG